MASNSFPGVSIEGGFVPPDALRDLDVSARVSARSTRGSGPAEPFLDPAGYGVFLPDTLDAACQRSYDNLRVRWKQFDAFRGQVVPRWLEPLLHELHLGVPAPTVLQAGGKEYTFSGQLGPLPLLLVPHTQGLDERVAGKPSAQGKAQEFINCSPGHLYAIISNGLELRLLRDNIRLTRQAYLSFDLEGIFVGGEFASFSLLWRLLHGSRFRVESGAKPAQCLFEKWREDLDSVTQRALENLRVGVKQALEALGQGFLLHPPLVTALREKNLSERQFNHQLLRLVYRLLFLLVAEDRRLLFANDALEQDRDLYYRYYSVSRLRRLAETMRGGNEYDLYEGLLLLFRALGQPREAATLHLTPLGGLFNSEFTQELDAARLPNESLLLALRHLTRQEVAGQIRPVDFERLGAEELGGVYEQLLQLEPEINLADPSRPQFLVFTASGNERKTSGSYYTPDSLVQCLLDSALEPVMVQAMAGLSGEPAAQALLNLTVCDPACGSAHFLVAAGRRLANRVARCRAGDELPSADEVRHAFRQVVNHCLYGVDLNPMAIELAKVALWLEAMEPGKPLGFLDHHLRCGNSLLGTTPRLLTAGLPDDAFTVISGDEKTFCTSLKRVNKQERDSAQGELAFFDMAGDTSAALASLESGEDNTLDEVRHKEKAYQRIQTEAEYRTSGQLLADAWCAAFVWPKKAVTADNDLRCPTTATLRRILKNPHDLLPSAYSEIRRLAGQFRFFHWHLAFPRIFRRVASGQSPDNPHTGWSGGFDCLLGNPPWERVKLQEKEWFATKAPAIANAPTAARKKMIATLKASRPEMSQDFLEDSRAAEGQSHLLRHSGLYPLGGVGDVNLYTVFAEHFRTLASAQGLMGMVMPSGIMTDDTTKAYFQAVMDTRSLVSIYDFENKGLFEDVHSSVKFCLFTSGRAENRQALAPRFVFFAHETADLLDPARLIELTADDIALLNPNTRTCPVFRSRADAELTKAIYRRVPVLIRAQQGDHPEENPWGIKFGTMFHMANDSNLFHTREQLEGDGWQLQGNVFRKKGEQFLPLYEAKMVHQFNHRWATYDGLESRDFTLEEKQDPECLVIPRYWVKNAEVQEALKNSGWDKKWLMGWRDICRNTDERTTISVAWPYCGAGDTFLQMFPKQLPKTKPMLSASLNSFVQDYACRQKIGGTHLKYHYFKQLPILTPETYIQKSRWSEEHNSLCKWLFCRILELSYTAWDLQPFAEDCGWSGPPFRWDEERRFLLRCELDAAFFHLYLTSTTEGNWKPSRIAEGHVQDETAVEFSALKQAFPTTRHAVDHILDTFPIVKRKDAEKYDGDYRTKRVILEIYDAMQEAMRSGVPYQTRLHPPPADPACCHPPR